MFTVAHMEHVMSINQPLALRSSNFIQFTGTIKVQVEVSVFASKFLAI